MKLPEEEVRKRVESAMERTGVSHLKDKPTHCLSFGQKKRVAIAGVLAMGPEVLVLDEPTAGLDPMGVSEIMHLLKETQKDLGISYVISTHDIAIVPIYCDYTYIMYEGNIVLKGTPKRSVFRKGSFKACKFTFTTYRAFDGDVKDKDGFEFTEGATTIAEARKICNDWKKDK